MINLVIGLFIGVLFLLPLSHAIMPEETNITNLQPNNLLEDIYIPPDLSGYSKEAIQKEFSVIVNSETNVAGNALIIRALRYEKTLSDKLIIEENQSENFQQLIQKGFKVIDTDSFINIEHVPSAFSGILDQAIRGEPEKAITDFNNLIATLRATGQFIKSEYQNPYKQTEIAANLIAIALDKYYQPIQGMPMSLKDALETKVAEAKAEAKAKAKAEFNGTLLGKLTNGLFFLSSAALNLVKRH